MGFDPGERSFINYDCNPTETNKNMKTTLQEGLNKKADY
jgi:hypothetical protein